MRRWSPYLRSVSLVPDRVPSAAPGFPWSLPCVQDLHLNLNAPVTFFVGDNEARIRTSSVSFDAEGGLSRVDLDETEHFQVTRRVLTDPARFWERLRG